MKLNKILKHEMLQDLITQHLIGEDVLQLFLVCREWNQLISENVGAMSKIKLVLTEKESFPGPAPDGIDKLRTLSDLVPSTKDESHRDLSPDDVIALLSSDREYRNLKFHFPCHEINKPKVQLLKRFSKFLVELELDFFIADVSVLPDNVDLPKLTSLVLKGWPNTEVILKIFKETRTLKKLAVESITGPNKTEFIIWIKQQKNLTELDVHTTRKDLFGTAILLGASFALKTLAFRSHEFNALSKEARKNFNIFMQKMSKSLKCFHLNYCQADDVEVILNKLPGLCSFSTNFCINNRAGALKLKPNLSIDEISWGGFSSIPRFLIYPVHSLEILKLFMVTKEDLVYIMNSASKLKHLIYKRELRNPTSLQDVLGWYQEIKNSKTILNRNVIITQEFFPLIDIKLGT